MSYNTSKPWHDTKGTCISIDPTNGLVKIDGLPVFKAFATPRGITIQFKDTDKLRSKYRGSALVEIPLRALIDRITESCG